MPRRIGMGRAQGVRDVDVRRRRVRRRVPRVLRRPLGQGQEGRRLRVRAGGHLALRARRARHRGVGAPVLRVPVGPIRHRVRGPEGCEEESQSRGEAPALAGGREVRTLQQVRARAGRGPNRG